MRTRVSQRQRRRARAFFSCRTGFLARANSQPYAQCVASRRYATFLLSDTSLRPVRSSLLTVKASSHGPAFRQAAVRACDGLVRARRDDPIVFITREPKSRARFFENFAALRSCRPETMGRLCMTLPIIDIAPLIRARYRRSTAVAAQIEAACHAAFAPARLGGWPSGQASARSSARS
jgi:hypothetical protein